MKGIILAGGEGSRLLPMTKVTNKHLLPVYDKPMIMFPLQSLINLGIKDIMIVSGKGHAGHFLELLSNGSAFGVRLSYTVQDKAGGIAEALALTEDFADRDSIAVILGDNIYENKVDISGYEVGSRIFLKEVSDPHRFGVASIDGANVVKIIEKPKNPESKYAVTGFYLYDGTVYDKIRKLKRSPRGELEITDVNNQYIEQNAMSYRMVDGFWTDAGTIESLHHASTLVKKSRDS